MTRINIIRYPKLRFPEFSDDWKSRELGSFADVSKLAGYEFTKHIVYSDKGTLIGLRGLNIKKNTLDLTEVKYVDNSELSKLSRSKLYIGDLMFTYVGTIGEVALIKENDKYYLAPNVSRIRINQEVASSEFINEYFLFDKFRKKQIDKYIATSSQPALSMTNIRKFILQVPSLEEQHRIVAFLTLVNRRIFALDNKLGLLKKYKKGMMQKIFSQQIRFKDENGNSYPSWEEKTIKESISFIKDGTHGSHSDTVDGSHLLLSAKNIKNGSVVYDRFDRKISDYEFNEISKNYKLQYGDILLSIVGTIGNVAIWNESLHNVAFQRSVAFLRFTSLKHKFAFQLFNTDSFQNELKRRSVVSAQPGVYLGDIAKIKIKIPCVNEQEKIADFLTAIDDIITLEERKLKEAKKFKKSLLQQMFI
jgi:type I restriction enzyme, S subunit